MTEAISRLLWWLDLHLSLFGKHVAAGIALAMRLVMSTMNYVRCFAATKNIFVLTVNSLS
jgi:hypothetical protein